MSLKISIFPTDFLSIIDGSEMEIGEICEHKILLSLPKDIDGFDEFVIKKMKSIQKELDKLIDEEEALINKKRGVKNA
jgi:hypothetical protein